jgi:Tfp pilus assembly protein PilO
MRQIVIMILMMHLFTECYAQKYILEIPFKYDYSLELIKKQSQMKETGLKNKTVVNDNSENLNDELLALKEKYSIILAVMPNKITNYKYTLT